MRARFVQRRRLRGDVPGMSRFAARNARCLWRVTGVTLVVMALGGVTVEAASLTVTWNAPTTNLDGSSLGDLAGYRVYLGTTQPACPGSSFHAVSSPTPSPDGGETVSTRVSALTAGTTYVARLTAVDTSGNESPCTGAVSGVARADFGVTPSTATSFGTIAVGSSVDRTFTVQNTGGASLSGTTSVGAPFRIVTGGSFSLAPGASQAVTVRFQPTSAGSFAGNATFTANGDTVSRSVSGATTGAAPSPPASTSPTPTVSSMSPTTAPAGDDGFTLTVNGSGFVASSVVRWNGVTIPATVVSPTQLQANIGAANLAVAGPVNVRVLTPEPGGGTSSALIFTLTATASVPPPGLATNVTVRQLWADAGGVTFAVSWSAGSGATSYRWTTGFNDGSAPDQGTVTGTSVLVRRPYHASQDSTDGFVCVRSVGPTGQLSTDQACNAVAVPARP
jgi:hypothetical protein